MGILKRNYLPSILCTLLYVNICDVQCFVQSYVSLSIDVYVQMSECVFVHVMLIILKYTFVQDGTTALQNM